MNKVLTSQISTQLKQKGYSIIKNFISKDTCKQGISQINKLVQQFQPNEHNTSIFGTIGKQAKSHHFTDKYFMESSDKVRFFFQPKAFQNGKLVVDKKYSIKKIAHALHQHHPFFRNISYSQGVRSICQSCNVDDPVIMQSMAMLKPPLIGNRVTIHQDLTFLYNQPQSLVGFWLALEDSTLQNGCLWGLPGSHNGPLYKRSKIVDGKHVEEILHQIDYKQQQFVPLEMESGSLLVFSGRFLHKSHQNLSKKSRYAYAFHLFDGSSKWSEYNWLQRPFLPKWPE